ncbi:hypothetical protein [Embleya sp. NPDC050493]|uniref:hypothetical protein n=1 Tax=Embleya sp. NPDC050493 TaxID=3363989 RepID=UPI0037BCAC54
MRTLYVKDPNGPHLEFTLDHPDTEKIETDRRTTVHADPARPLGRDHGGNNRWR